MIPTSMNIYSSDMGREGHHIFIQLLQPHHDRNLLEFKTNNRSFFQPYSPIQSDEQFTLHAQQKFIQTAIQEAKADQGYRFGIFDKTNNQLIGQINLTGLIRGSFQNALLGYSMDERCNGKGYMTEAVALCIQIAFDDLRLHRIQAAVMPRNKGSIRVLLKNGFAEEGYSRNYLYINGVWEDHLLFALLSDDVPAAITQA